MNNQAFEYKNMFDKCREICSFPTGLEIQRWLLLCNVWGRYRKDVPSQIPGSYSTKIQSL